MHRGTSGWGRTLCAVVIGLGLLATSLELHAGGLRYSYKLIHGFRSNHGFSLGPSALVVGVDGLLYGTTSNGGASGNGQAFQLLPSGEVTVLHDFINDGTDASGPKGLTPASDGSFYGASVRGGANGRGSVFRMSAAGEVTLLHSFSGTDGKLPWGPLTWASDGNLYGTTSRGGDHNCGTIFRITPAGDLSTLRSFRNSDGCVPNAPLTQGSDGYLYGTSSAGGLGDGVVFRVSLAGTVKTLHLFDGLNGADGATPYGTVIEASDGNFYGTTAEGGSTGHGTVFKMTGSGKVTVLHSFAAHGADGDTPFGGLVETPAHELAGTAVQGGAHDYGTVYLMSFKGKLRIAHDFDRDSGDGAGPLELTVTDDGSLYGGTDRGGARDGGTLYRLTPRQANTMFLMTPR